MVRAAQDVRKAFVWSLAKGAEVRKALTRNADIAACWEYVVTELHIMGATQMLCLGSLSVSLPIYGFDCSIWSVVAKLHLLK
jgi:hypothetical protein